MTRVDRKKVEYGDFQTPSKLALVVCDLLKNKIDSPKVIIEPTCGIGEFFLASINTFPYAEKGMAFDINPTYIHTLKERLPTESTSVKMTVDVADFFEKDWETELSKLSEPILFIGNPPWVTNSQIGQIQGKNLPKKINHDQHRGLDALTGKSNFDISEWMLIRIIDWLQKKTGTLAMLCKTSVARKVLLYAWKNNRKIGKATMHMFDAKKYFDISADTCLLTVSSSKVCEKECVVYSNLTEDEILQTFGFCDGTMVADVFSYKNTHYLFDRDNFYNWRSGVKHDCSKIMELEKMPNGQYINGLSEQVDIEDNHVFPLLKSSDVANDRSPRKYVLIPHRQVGEDTRHLECTSPKTWAYLLRNAKYFDERKSSIYKGKSRFSIFGVGDYTFQPWKIAISGLYKKLEFCVVGPYENKPVVFDDTVNFISLENKDEAFALVELLNSKLAKQFYESYIFWDSKRPITIQLLKTLNIDALMKNGGVKNDFSINKPVSNQLQLIA